jgi:Nuclease-related domain
MLGLRWRAAPPAADRAAALLARQQADRAAEAELRLRQQQQRRAGWLEANVHLGPAYRQVIRELAWQRRAHGLAAEHDPPGYLRGELGPLPESTRGRRVWRQAAATIEDYRHTYGITDPDQALGPVPREPAQRAAWQHARQAITQVQDRQRNTDRQPQRAAASHPPPVDRHQQDQSSTRRSERAMPSAAGPGAGRRLAPQGGPHATAPTQPHPDPDGVWPSGDDQPGISIRPLRPPTWPLCSPPRPPGHDQDPGGLDGLGGPAPVVAVRVRASVGQPGASARAEYRRRHASELATWTRTLPWRVGAVLGIGVLAWLLAAQVAARLAAVAAVVGVCGVAWALRFRVSPDTLAWWRGAQGEQRTARLLAPLERRGWAVLHDLAIPGSRANIDHLVIGPGGVVVIDSKQYRGRLRLDSHGFLWHGRTCWFRACGRFAGRPTRPTRCWASPRSRSPPSSPSTAPASPGGGCRSTGSPSHPPAVSPTCSGRYHRSLGPSGWPGWPTGPDCASVLCCLTAGPATAS